MANEFEYDAIEGNESYDEENGFNFERYHVSSFQSTNSKRVPLEELDFSIYNAKANLVVFSSTEERLPLWVNALSRRYKSGLADSERLSTIWKEESNEENPSKCDKISITLTARENGKNIITLNILMNKGRIQCQGRHIQDWGNVEFPALLKSVNDPHLMASNPTQELDTFIDKVFSTKNGSQQTTAISQQQPDDHLLSLDSSIQSSQSSQEKPLSTIKNLLASLEAEFIEYKQGTNITLTKLNTAVCEKDKELVLLRNEISSLKTDHFKTQQFSSDLSLKQSYLEDNLQKLTHKCKSLAEKNSMLLGKLAALNEDKETHSLNNTPTVPDTPTITSISTSNSFQPLVDESPNQMPALSSVSTPNQNNSETCAEPPPEQQPNEADKSTQDQPSPTSSNSDNGNITEKDGTLILCDSNGRHLKLPLLCPDTKAKYIRCPTLNQAKSILSNDPVTAPKSLIIHTGTNDLEHTKSNEEIIKCAMDTVEFAQNKHPDCHIIFSSILPRKDKLHKRAIDINYSLDKLLSSKKNVTFTRHPNISATYHLKDKKHLNDIGVKRFAQNLKRAYFHKSATPKMKFQHTHPPRNTRHQNYILPNPGQQQFPPFNFQNKYPPTRFLQQAPRINNPYNLYHHTPTHHHQPMQQIPPVQQTRATTVRKREEIPVDLIKMIKDLHRYVG